VNGPDEGRPRGNKNDAAFFNGQGYPYYFTKCIRSFAGHSGEQLYFVPQAPDNAANGQMRFSQKVKIFQAIVFFK